MGVYSGPEIVKDGLVLHLDAATTKSFRGEPTVNLFSTFSSNPDNAILLGVSPISLACGSGANWSRCNYGGGTYTYSHIETKNPYGNQSLVGNLISTVTGGDYRATISNIGSSTLNRTFTFSMWIKNNGGTVSTIQMSIRTNGDANGPNASKTITSEWQRISITHTFTGTCTAEIRSYIFGLNAGANLLFYGAQLEEQAYPTPFVNGTRGTTVATGGGWADLSGNTNHGELVNGPTFNSGNLGSLVFDGVDDYVLKTQSVNLPIGNSDRTISVWYYATTSSYNLVQIGTGGAGTGTQAYIISSAFSGSTNFIYTDGINGSNNITASGSQIPQLNRWNNFVFGNLSQNYFYYLNGEFQKSEIWPTALNTVGQQFAIGRRLDTSPSYLNGNISQVSIYNKALTPQEIRQNFYATRGRYGV